MSHPASGQDEVSWGFHQAFGLEVETVRPALPRQGFFRGMVPCKPANPGRRGGWEHAAPCSQTLGLQKQWQRFWLQLSSPFPQKW